ncbi:MAG: GNAT family N-acetyltransferase [Planctomycetota bacterium]|jgi:hypothetical protein
MRIVNANTIKAKEDITGLIAKAGAEQSPEAIDMWLSSFLGTDVFGAWLAFDEKDVPVGLLVCEMIDNPPAAYISFYYKKPGTTFNGEMMNKAEEWAKGKDLHKLILYCEKSPMTLIKKYGFKLVRHILDKEI